MDGKVTDNRPEVSVKAEGAFVRLTVTLSRTPPHHLVDMPLSVDEAQELHEQLWQAIASAEWARLHSEPVNDKPFPVPNYVNVVGQEAVGLMGVMNYASKSVMAIVNNFPQVVAALGLSVVEPVDWANEGEPEQSEPKQETWHDRESLF